VVTFVIEGFCESVACIGLLVKRNGKLFELFGGVAALQTWRVRVDSCYVTSRSVSLVMPSSSSFEVSSFVQSNL
jgi:hypothetical protein